jgi:hypothetical protein
MRVDITYFPALRAAHGQRVRTTWAALLKRLEVPRVCCIKEEVPGFSLATYAGDRRSLANVELVYAIGLDLDEGLTWDLVRTRFSDCASFIHTTWSSTLAAPRARVFLPLSRPVTGAEYRRVYSAVVGVVEAGGLKVDRAASDPSRFWFLPAIPSNYTPFFAAAGNGNPVNVDGALASVPEPEPPPAPLPPSGPVGDIEKRATAYLEKVGPAISGSGGHTHTFAVAVKLVKGFSLDEQTAYRLLARWNQTCSPPWSEWELRRKIRQAAERGSMPDGALRDAGRQRA